VKFKVTDWHFGMLILLGTILGLTAFAWTPRMDRVFVGSVSFVLVGLVAAAVLFTAASCTRR